jgi:TPR repeat protein
MTTTSTPCMSWWVLLIPYVPAVVVDTTRANRVQAILHEGEGNDVIIPDIDYARDLFTKAGELGYAPSQFRLGCAFEYGQLGCPVDPRRSIAWYSKAAMKGT